MQRWGTLIASAGVALALLGGCSATQAEPQPAISAPPETPLPMVQVSLSGGRCVQGVCNDTVKIDTEGAFEWNGTSGQSSGMISAEELNTIKRAISNTNFEQVKSHAFTGTCPVEVDGQELIYTFFLPNSVEVIPSCRFDINATTHEGTFTTIMEIANKYR